MKKRKLPPPPRDDSVADAFIFRTSEGERVLTVGVPEPGEELSSSESQVLSALNFRFKPSSAGHVTVYILTYLSGAAVVLDSVHPFLTTGDVTDLAKVGIRAKGRMKSVRAMPKFPLAIGAIKLIRLVDGTWEVYTRRPLRVSEVPISVCGTGADGKVCVLRSFKAISLQPDAGSPVVRGDNPLVDFVSSFLSCEVMLPAPYKIGELGNDAVVRLWHVVHVASNSACVFTNPGKRMLELIDEFGFKPPSFSVTHQPVITDNWPTFSGWHCPGLTTEFLTREIELITKAPLPVIGIILSLSGPRTVDFEHFISDDAKQRYNDVWNAFGELPNARCRVGRVAQAVSLGRAHGIGPGTPSAIRIDTGRGVVTVTFTDYVSRVFLASLFNGALPLSPLEIYQKRAAVASCVFDVDGHEVDTGFALGLLLRNVGELTPVVVS